MKYLLSEKYFLNEKFILLEAPEADADVSDFNLSNLSSLIRLQFNRLPELSKMAKSEVFLRKHLINLFDLERKIKKITTDRSEELNNLYLEYLTALEELLEKRFSARIRHDTSEAIANNFNNAVSNLKNSLSTKTKNARQWEDIQTNFTAITSVITNAYKSIADKNTIDDLADIDEMLQKLLKEKLVEKPAEDEEYRSYLIDRIISKAPKNKKDSGFNDPEISLLKSKNENLYNHYRQNLIELSKQLTKIVGTDKKFEPLTNTTLYETVITEVNKLLDIVSADASNILSIYGVSKERSAAKADREAAADKLAKMFNWAEVAATCTDWNKFWNGDETSDVPELKLGFMKYTFKDKVDLANKIGTNGDDLKIDIQNYGFNTEANALLLFVRFALKNDFKIDTDNYTVLHNAYVKEDLTKKDLRGEGTFEKGCVIFRKALWLESPDDIARYINLQRQLDRKKDSLDIEARKAMSEPKTARVIISNIMLKPGNLSNLVDQTILGSINTAELRDVFQVETILSRLIKIEDINKTEKAALQAADVDEMLKDTRLSDKDTVKKALVYLSDIWLADNTDLIDRINKNEAGGQLYALSNTYHANAREKEAFTSIFKLKTRSWTKAQIQALMIKLLKAAGITK